MILEPDDWEVLTRVIEKAISTEFESLMNNNRFGNGRIGYTESEAANSLGINKHVLRDARYRNEFSPRKIGKQYIYSHEMLNEYLKGNE